MPVRIFEVETASATTFVDLAIAVAEGPTAIRNPFGLYPSENLIEVGLADMKCIVMTAASFTGVEAGSTPGFRFVGESECQALIDLYLCEMTIILDCQPKDLREKFR